MMTVALIQCYYIGNWTYHPSHQTRTSVWGCSAGGEVSIFFLYIDEALFHSVKTWANVTNEGMWSLCTIFPNKISASYVDINFQAPHIGWKYAHTFVQSTKIGLRLQIACTASSRCKCKLASDGFFRGIYFWKYIDINITRMKWIMIQCFEQWECLPHTIRYETSAHALSSYTSLY